MPTDLQPETAAVRMAISAGVGPIVRAAVEKLMAGDDTETMHEVRDAQATLAAALATLDTALREARASSERWARREIAACLRDLGFDERSDRTLALMALQREARVEPVIADALRDAHITGPDDLVGWEEW